MGKIIKFRKKEVEDITTREFFGEEIIPFVDGGIYYLDISGEGFNRPYIALPDDRMLTNYSYMNMKKFLRVTSNQYSFFDIPVGTSGNSVSFAGTHEVIVIQNREFYRKQNKGSIDTGGISPWIYPTYKIHPFIMDLILRTVHRNEISDPEEFANLVDEIYRYCKHIESLHLPLYSKKNSTSMLFNAHPTQKTYYKFRFDSMDKPEMLSYILEGFGDGPKLIVPETVEDPKPEVAKEEPAPKPEGNGSFNKSFAEKVQAAFAATNPSSTEEKVMEVFEKADADAQEEKETTETGTLTDVLPPDEVVSMKVIPESELGKVTDNTCLPSRYLPKKPEKKLYGPVDPELVKRLPAPGILVSALTKDQMLAYVEVLDKYKTTVAMKTMGYSVNSRKTVNQRYDAIVNILKKFDDEAVETLSESETEIEPEKEPELTEDQSEIVVSVSDADDCEDLRGFIDVDEIERHLNTKTGNPSVDGVSGKFSLSKMRTFIEMDKMNVTNGIMTVFNLKSKSQIIRLRGKILNELDARKESGEVNSIPHRTDFVKTTHFHTGRDSIKLSAVGVYVFLTDAAKYPIRLIRLAYQIDNVEFGNLFAFCLEIYRKNNHK